MAGKNGSGTSYVSSQYNMLLEAASAAYNAFNEKYEEIKSIIAQIESDEVIGDSTSKDELLEVLKGMDSTFTILNEKVGNVQKTLQEVQEAVEAASNSNESAMADKAEDEQNIAKRAEETNGSGAN